MEWITWGDALHLGHDGIDSGHQKLAAIINRLADGVINHSILHSPQELLGELIERAMAHFAEEDQMMAVHRYPDADAHQAEHQNLLRSAGEFMAELEAQGSPSVSLLRFLRRWLTTHIVTMDRQLVTYLENSR